MDDTGSQFEDLEHLAITSKGVLRLKMNFSPSNFEFENKNTISKYLYKLFIIHSCSFCYKR